MERWSSGDAIPFIPSFGVCCNNNNDDDDVRLKFQVDQNVIVMKSLSKFFR